MTEFQDRELRHFCRNTKCRSKLKRPVSNKREAFCARGCHTAFYRKRCLVCEGPIERNRDDQKICGRAMCRRAWRARTGFGRYIASSAANLPSKKPVNKGPCVDGSELARTFFTSAVLVGAAMCSASISAVHVTAGHNALRGSGPGQKDAFDNALAHVGCPDRRIDRLCITCCSPSQHLHITPDARCDLVKPRARLVPYSVRSWPSSPTLSVRSCWRARWRRPS